MKIIFDTNVILAAFLTEGLCYKVLNRCIGNFEIIISNWIIREVTEKLKIKFNVPSSQIQSVTRFIKNYFIHIEPSGEIPDICRDKDDNNVIHLAEFSKADIIITGDKDLLDIGVYKKCKIISPRQFWELLVAN